MRDKKRVVIIGGGFAGLNAAKTLADKDDIEVFLIDQRNHHLFQPLLYQVATAGLNAGHIATPIRAQFAKTENVHVHLGHVELVDRTQKYVMASGFKLNYDFLILACGARHSYFAHPEWEPFAPGLKTIEQAIEIRRRIFLAFEMAENALNPELQKAYLTFASWAEAPPASNLRGPYLT